MWQNYVAINIYTHSYKQKIYKQTNVHVVYVNDQLTELCHKHKQFMNKYNDNNDAHLPDDTLRQQQQT